MKTRILGITTVATLGTLFTLAPDAEAAGTALDVQNGRGTGMASATTAWINDASAIFYNTAGLAQGKKLMVEAGVNLIVPSFRYKSPAGNETNTEGVATPFQAYASGGITDDLSVGVGIFTPFGLDLKWPDGWQGRSQLTSASLRTFYIQPSVAYRFGRLRVGGGVQVVRATLELERDINFGDRYGHADIGGGTWGVGGVGGVQLEAIKQYLNLGVQYRSAVRLKFDDARVHFSGIPAGFTGALHDQAVTGALNQPDSISMGVSSRPIEALNVAVDVVWLGWGKFHSVALNYPNDTSGTLSSVQAKNWDNTANVHVGAEGTLSDHWQIRGGVLIDPSPSPNNTLTPDIPDSTRVNLAAGGTYKADCGVHVDLGYQFIVLTGKTSTVANFPGDYGGLVNIVGLTVGYTTPDKPPPPPPPALDPNVSPAPVYDGTAPAPPPPPADGT